MPRRPGGGSSAPPRPAAAATSTRVRRPRSPRSGHRWRRARAARPAARREYGASEPLRTPARAHALHLSSPGPLHGDPVAHEDADGADRAVVVHGQDEPRAREALERDERMDDRRVRVHHVGAFPFARSRQSARVTSGSGNGGWNGRPELSCTPARCTRPRTRWILTPSSSSNGGVPGTWAVATLTVVAAIGERPREAADMPLRARRSRARTDRRAGGSGARSRRASSRAASSRSGTTASRSRPGRARRSRARTRGDGEGNRPSGSSRSRCRASLSPAASSKRARAPARIAHGRHHPIRLGRAAYGSATEISTETRGLDRLDRYRPIGRPPTARRGRPRV